MSIGTLGNVGSADNVRNWGTVGMWEIWECVRNIDSNPQKRFKLPAVAAFLPPKPFPGSLASLAELILSCWHPPPPTETQGTGGHFISDTQCISCIHAFTHCSLLAPPPHSSSGQILNPCTAVIHVSLAPEDFHVPYPPQAVKGVHSSSNLALFFFCLIFHYNYGFLKLVSELLAALTEAGGEWGVSG